ncbi:hypothetical protein VTN49DRAFT_4582 [Thermomyces lanuginosus]|uniref:uncharacterized protein n=1 Tax=Thermomyces lanuginosus TaxID=5541 RepID=UPI00374205AC
MLLNPRLVPGPANKASFLRGLTANERHERHNQHCTVHSPSFARAAGFDAGPLAPQRGSTVKLSQRDDSMTGIEKLRQIVVVELAPSKQKVK